MPAHYPESDVNRTFDSEPTNPLCLIPEEPTRLISVKPNPRLPPRRGKITTVACSWCQQRKSKCDGRRPLCGPCSKNENVKACSWELPRGQKRSVFLRAQVAKHEEENANLKLLIIQTLRNNLNPQDHATDEVRREIEACVESRYSDTSRCLDRLESAKIGQVHLDQECSPRYELKEIAVSSSSPSSGYVYGRPNMYMDGPDELRMNTPVIWSHEAYRYSGPFLSHSYSETQGLVPPTYPEAEFESIYPPASRPLSNMAARSAYSFQSPPEFELPTSCYVDPDSKRLLVVPTTNQITHMKHHDLVQPMCFCPACNNTLASTAAIPSTSFTQGGCVSFAGAGTMNAIPDSTCLPWSSTQSMYINPEFPTVITPRPTVEHNDCPGLRVVSNGLHSDESTPPGWSPHTPDSGVWMNPETSYNSSTPFSGSRHWEPIFAHYTTPNGFCPGTERYSSTNHGPHFLGSELRYGLCT